MIEITRTIPIYKSGGEVGGFLKFPYIFNRDGEWIGWVTSSQQVYSVHGHFVGWLTNEPRILRKQSSGYLKPPGAAARAGAGQAAGYGTLGADAERAAHRHL